MNLLGAVCYDPATAASKATSALLAMTAFDTTNLRATVTVPAHGKLRFRIFGGAITGATTLPTILIGFLNGATVVARVTPRDFPATMNAATQTVPIEADFTVTGLTPGSITLDLAYAVQVIVASTVIKYGGPNTNAGANAWGAMCFEVWDPSPVPTNWALLSIDANGRVDVSKVAGTAQTARDLGLQLDATMSSRMATYTQPTGFLAATFPTSVASPTNITAASGVSLAASQHVIVDSGTVTTLTNLPSIPANWLTAAGIAASALNGKGDWLLASGYTAPDNTRPANFTALAITAGGAMTAGTVSDKTGYALTSAYDPAKTAAQSTDYTAARALKLDNLDAAVSSRSTYAGGDTAGTTTLIARLTALRAGNLDSLDAAVTSRLASASYTAPDNASVATILTRTDVATSTRAAAGDAMALTVAERASVADKLLGRSVAGGSDAGRLVKEALAVLRNKVAVVGGVLTVYDTDDATVLFTAAVTTAPGNPISVIDPA